MNELSPYILAAALAWASGIRLYAVLFLVGVAGKLGWLTLSPEMAILSHHWVIGASASLLIVEFFADKVPALDSAWDVLHTLVRIPAGALLAAGVIAPQDGAAWALAAGLIGGTITAGTHFTKAGGRAMVNLSPEPFSNWGTSLFEDGLVFLGLWLAFKYPAIFGGLLVLFLLLVIWLLPKIWQAFTSILRVTIGRLLHATRSPPARDG